MRIAHFSDLHARLKVLDVLKDNPPDLWISSGDFFPDGPWEQMPNPEYQREWFTYNGETIKKYLCGRPILCIDGNHDWVHLAELLDAIHVETHQITPEGIEVAGLRFAGYPNVTPINGMWNYETPHKDFVALNESLIKANPHFVVTHSPPEGILDASICGIPNLIHLYIHEQLKPKAHFFGHIHEGFGHKEFSDIQFFNSACGLQVYEFDIKEIIDATTE